MQYNFILHNKKIIIKSYNFTKEDNHVQQLASSMNLTFVKRCDDKLYIVGFICH